MDVLDKVWLGGVWLVYSVCNIKGTCLACHARNVYILLAVAIVLVYTGTKYFTLGVPVLVIKAIMC